MREYPLGQAIEITASFVDKDGAAANPTTTTFRVGLIAAQPPPQPTAVEYVSGTDPEVTNPATGSFRLVITPTESGVYLYDVVGTGAVAAVPTTGKFRVLPSPFA